MPVAALVVTLSNDESRQTAVERLEARDDMDLGPLEQAHLPVVLETETLGEGSHIVRDELPEIPGVEFVRVVRVDFDDAELDETDEPPTDLF